MPTSRQLVTQTLEFDLPANQRIPRDLWLLPWATDKYRREVDDIIARFPPDIATAPAPGRVNHVQGDPYEVGIYVDEWDCVFVNYQRGVIGEVKHAAIPTWDQLDQLRLPVERLSFDVAAVNAFCRASDKFVLAGCCPRPFERLQFLRTSQQLFLDLGENAPELDELIGSIHAHYMQELELWAKTGVDGLMFMDDWGAQNRLLISPRQWRKIFKPLYKDYIDLAHAHGKKIFMHSDGYTADIIPDLVELGLDAINAQLFTMNIEDLGRCHGGKITFWGEIDRQNLLPFGTRSAVDTAVRRVHASLYANGGVIGQCEFSAGGRPENVWQVYETWEKLGGKQNA